MTHTDENNSPSERTVIATGYAYCLVQQETLRNLRRVLEVEEIDDGQVVRGVLNAFLAQQEWLAKITDQAQLENQQHEQAMSEFFKRFTSTKRVPQLPRDLTTIEYETKRKSRASSPHTDTESEGRHKD